MKTWCKFYLSLVLMAWCISAHSQDEYLPNGSATKDNCRCYTLTRERPFETGSVWNKNKISLTNPFDFKFDVFFGCGDAIGADGMTFMLQPLGTSVGNPGQGMGFEGVKPGVAVTMDTWQNFGDNDPAYDHMAIQVNGAIKHDGSELAGPLRISATNDNVEDCKWHTLRVVWEPASKTFTIYFDEVQRLQVTKDFVTDIFAGDPMVYWGFTGATGDNYNLQQFCTRLDPRFRTSSANNTTCVGKPLQFLNQSESFTKIAQSMWLFGDGATSTQENPSHTYNAPGLYEAKLVITGFDGCTSDTLRRMITVGQRPQANFTVYDTCRSLRPRVQLGPTTPNSTWTWKLNGQPVAGNPVPNMAGLNPGTYNLQQVVRSSFDCDADSMTMPFIIHPAPQIQTTVSDACINQLMSFGGRQTDAGTTITRWNWAFGDGNSSNLQNPTHTYSVRGRMAVRTWATSTIGCQSDTVVKFLEVVRPIASAGRDTIVYINQPFMLNGIGQGKFLWSPGTHLSATDIRNPIAKLPTDQQYVLTVTTNNECISRDTINIKVTTLMGVFVPTAFTPNGDGLNDRIHPRYYGVKRLQYFTIFNRWGQKVFESSNMQAVWDGTAGGRKLPTDTFVWVMVAEDLVGKVKEERGTILLIR